MACCVRSGSNELTEDGPDDDERVVGPGTAALLRAMMHRQKDVDCVATQHDFLDPVPAELLSEFGVPHEYADRSAEDVCAYLRSVAEASG